MGKVRILRIMTYTYDSTESMLQDRRNWHVQNTFAPYGGLLIRSAVLDPEILEEVNGDNQA